MGYIIAIIIYKKICDFCTLMIIIIIDVDECQDLKNRCLDNEECMNNEGSYSCPCKAGYEKLTGGKCNGKLIL